MNNIYLDNEVIGCWHNLTSETTMETISAFFPFAMDRRSHNNLLLIFNIDESPSWKLELTRNLKLIK